jgi:hypothetical protein
MMKESGKEVPHRTLFREVITVMMVSLCFWGAFFGALWWHSRQQHRRQSDERFVLKRLASRSMTQDRLPLSVLSELLDVQADEPLSVFAIQPDEAKRRLLACPSMAQANVWRLLPGTIGVEYALRLPVASLAGLKNVAIDWDGKMFFLFPFYAQKNLPVLVVPMLPVKTLNEAQKALYQSKEAPIALRLLERVQQAAAPRHLIVESIDVSRFREHSVFRREAVLVLSSLLAKEKHLYVRIGLKNLLPSLDLLPALCDRLVGDGFRSGTIDLRYEQMAILSGEVAQT